MEFSEKLQNGAGSLLPVILNWMQILCLVGDFPYTKKRAQVAATVLLADIGVARILLLKFSKGVLPLVTRDTSCNEASLGSILPGPKQHGMFPNFPQTAGNEGMERNGNYYNGLYRNHYKDLESSTLKPLAVHELHSSIGSL